MQSHQNPEQYCELEALQMFTQLENKMHLGPRWGCEAGELDRARAGGRSARAEGLDSRGPPGTSERPETRSLDSSVQGRLESQHRRQQECDKYLIRGHRKHSVRAHMRLPRKVLQSSALPLGGVILSPTWCSGLGWDAERQGRF